MSRYNYEAEFDSNCLEVKEKISSDIEMSLHDIRLELYNRFSSIKNLSYREVADEQ